MGLFGRKQKKTSPGFLAVQTSPPVNELRLGSRISGGRGSIWENRLYRSLRESVPVIDAAIYKIVRLTGGFQVRCRDSRAQEAMDSFVKNVRVNGISAGLAAFVNIYLEQLLTYGTAVGEIVLGEDMTIKALYNSNINDVRLSCGENPLDVEIGVRDSAGNYSGIKHPELVVCSAIMPEPGSIYGTSILRGLPFVSDILMKILGAVGTNWDRVGNVRFAVTYRPGENERSFGRERAAQIASEWSKAMKSSDPRDFICVGDVDIKAIGADNQIPDCAVPIRQIMEQITAKLSIPPFLLGLSWSTTERMSTQQADMLTSELEYYRRILEAPVRKICSGFLRLEGFDDSLDIIWDNINLQDEVELAKARLYNAQAEEKEINNRKEG